MFTVGQVARAAGVSAKPMRLYEARGLLPPAARNTAGYRVFQASDVDTVASSAGSAHWGWAWTRRLKPLATRRAVFAR